jgi:hypothetical protein
MIGTTTVWFTGTAVAVFGQPAPPKATPVDRESPSDTFAAPSHPGGRVAPLGQERPKPPFCEYKGPVNMR